MWSLGEAACFLTVFSVTSIYGTERREHPSVYRQASRVEYNGRANFTCCLGAVLLDFLVQTLLDVKVGFSPIDLLR